MNLVRHVASVIYLDKKYYEKTYPDILLPLNDTINTLQYAVYCSAIIGCRTIWIISNGDYPEYVKQCIGDYIPDPSAYNLGYDIKDKLIPIYFMNIRGLKKDRAEYSEIELVFKTKKLLDKTVRAVSDFLVPEKWFITNGNFVYPLKKLKSYKERIIEDNNELLLFRNKNNHYFGAVVPNYDINLMIKNHNDNKENNILKLFDNFSKENVEFYDGYVLDSMNSYKEIINDHEISSFVYPSIFEKYKTPDTFGMNQAFIAKDTKINLTVKREKNDKVC